VSDDTLSPFNTVYDCERQTDRENCHSNMAWLHSDMWQQYPTYNLKTLKDIVLYWMA